MLEAEPVIAASSIFAAAAAEDRRDDIPQPEAAQIAEVDVLRAARGAGRTPARRARGAAAQAIERAQSPHLVVVLPLVGIGQRGMRL